MKNIILLGFMGTGKTAAGKRLAEELQRDFLDVDELIEKESGTSISEIFFNFGEEHFRRLEAEKAKEVSKYENMVIATGGGIVLREENIENLRKNGVLICLSASPEVIMARTKAEKNRPLLDTPYPLETIKELLHFRAPLYARAEVMIDTSQLTIGEVVTEIKKIAEEIK
ncbi:shikimate kinase [candidate division NPL-UPA2 bacterium Unc8]|uniref:Shikimate kinase n=1 Tax=candidate division NPL-UPA2 bacterium Unc8 TaxID=1980939 RepID=A0A399G0L2_UNCN2|nr:MAG: shikimate kinase [candidate division NPL-UPA2 bacterium Unc8]